MKMKTVWVRKPKRKEHGMIKKTQSTERFSYQIRQQFRDKSHVIFGLFERFTADFI